MAMTVASEDLSFYGTDVKSKQKFHIEINLPCKFKTLPAFRQTFFYVNCFKMKII